VKQQRSGTEHCSVNCTHLMPTPSWYLSLLHTAMYRTFFVAWRPSGIVNRTTIFIVLNDYVRLLEPVRQKQKIIQWTFSSLIQQFIWETFLCNLVYISGSKLNLGVYLGFHSICRYGFFSVVEQLTRNK
jgi:hypothetical protein